MNYDVMKKWTKALRSGEYKQGKDWLKNTDEDGVCEWCCLGVLCDIYNKEVKSDKLPEDFVAMKIRDGRDIELNDDVQEWAGLKYPNGVFDKGGKAYCLADMNDARGYKKPKSFKEIADIIETNYKIL